MLGGFRAIFENSDRSWERPGWILRNGTVPEKCKWLLERLSIKVKKRFEEQPWSLEPERLARLNDKSNESNWDSNKED
jgi:hypothetical protein